MELQQTKQPRYRFFVGCEAGSDIIQTHFEESTVLEQLYKDDGGDLEDESSFQEWLFDSYLSEGNFETWTEIEPTMENLRELQNFCNAMAEDLGVR